MQLFPNLSLRRKLALIMMLTSTLTLLLACVAFVGVEALNFHAALLDEISTMAQIAGNNCSAALDFRNPKDAEDTLGALRAEPSIVRACVYDRQGVVFAAYQRLGKITLGGFPPVQPPGQEFGGNQLRVSRTITIRGEKVGSIYVACDLHEFNNRLKHFAGIAVLVLGISLLAAFFLSMQLQRVVSGPVLQLAQAVHTVTLEKNYSTRAAKLSNDELGQLVDGFNEMLAQIQARDSALQTARDHLEARVADRTRELESTHRQLLEASRLGGMAEVATNVLHNVGNVLNSVNISASLVVDRVKKSKASSLVKVAALLREHEPDLGAFFTGDPRGRQLPGYLSQLAEHFLEDQQATIKELDLLRDNIDHIKEIVAMQQSYSKVSGIKEIINLNELVEDSLRMNAGALARHGVEVIRDFETLPPMNVEKHKILQILVNLIRNAKYACEESHRGDKRLMVRLVNGDGRVKICVIDNGVGIPPENLTRVFNHGFTTRKEGHGFGLHSGALAAKEMGGALIAQSDGPGCGATFTLELPRPTNGDLHE